MFERIKRKLRRRKIHKDETKCYKCGEDQLPMRWHIEKIGRFTYEEGYICQNCYPEDPEETIVMRVPDAPLGEPMDLKKRMAEWEEYVKGVTEQDAEP